MKCICLDGRLRVDVGGCERLGVKHVMFSLFSLFFSFRQGGANPNPSKIEVKLCLWVSTSTLPVSRLWECSRYNARQLWGVPRRTLVLEVANEWLPVHQNEPNKGGSCQGTIGSCLSVFLGRGSASVRFCYCKLHRKVAGGKRLPRHEEWCNEAMTGTKRTAVFLSKCSRWFCTGPTTGCRAIWISVCLL